MKIKLFLAIILATSMFAVSLPMGATSWMVWNYGDPKTYRASALSQGGVSIDLPQTSSGKYVNYAAVNYKKAITVSGMLTATVRVVITGSPAFNYKSETFNTCVTPATVRPYIERTGTLETYRWRAVNPYSYPLQGRVATITVPLS